MAATTEVSRQFSTLIVNAFSVVAALAWSDAISSYLHKIRFFSNHPLAGPFFFAVGVTLLAFLVGKALTGQVQQSCTRLCEPAKTPTPAPTPRAVHAQPAAGAWW